MESAPQGELLSAHLLRYASCECNKPFTGCKNYDCTYVDSLGNADPNVRTCQKCSKSDVTELEDAGWVCN